MIKINLLPYPEELKKARANTEISIFFAVLLVICLGLFLFQKSRRAVVNQLMANISEINANVDKLKDVDPIHTEIITEKDKVKVKLDAINAVTKAKRNPIKHLDELTAITPDTVWLTKFSLQGSNISMDCKSMSYYDVSRFYNNIVDSKCFNIDKFPSVAEGEKFGDKPIYQFSLSCIAEWMVLEEPARAPEDANKKGNAVAGQIPQGNKS